MKKFYVITFFLLSTFLMFGQENEDQKEASKIFPEPTIDRRVELLSIVFRLAGNLEYNSSIYGSYVQDIHSHFDEYKEHPVISLASKLRIENSISSDAVMKMAFHIGQPPAFTPEVQFSENVPDMRWGSENANRFLELLRDFYTASEFENFFNEHKGLYDTALKRFSLVYEAINIPWFSSYYGGKPGGTYHVIISLGNGSNSYGGKLIYADHTEDVYSIMGTWVIDSTDLPVYTMDDYRTSLLHEFHHLYANPLIDKYEAQLKASGKIIFEPIQDILKRYAYDQWKVMMYEYLVRASVIRYLLKHDSHEAAKKQLIEDEGRGFSLTKDLVKTLHDYESNRNQYKTMESFMPVLVSFFDNVVQEGEMEVRELDIKYNN